MTEKELLPIISTLAEKLGVEVYAVGGHVRDHLLGIEQKTVVEEENRIVAALQKDVIEGGDDVVVEKIIKKRDIDFVVVPGNTEIGGVAFVTAFDEVMGQSGSLVLFEQFNTARYVFDDIEIEFAGARKEAYDPASRKPIVVSGTLLEDLARRDFTVNAMAQRVTSDGLGEIVDPFDGQKDLNEKILRTPLDPMETFSEDPLRIMRAARFAAQLNFSIEATTLKAMYDVRERLSIISAERIAEEFFKLLGTAQPSVGLWILYQTHIFDQFLPEVPALSGVEEIGGQGHKDNLTHTFKVVDNLATRTNKPLLRYAGLMHDIGKPETKSFIKGRGWAFDMHEHVGKRIVHEVAKRLKMSIADTRYVAKLVRWHQQPIALMDDTITDSAVRRLVVSLGDEIDDLLKLCRSDITTGNPNKLEKRLKNYDVLEKKIIEVIEKDKLRAFQSPLRGEEIMQLSGLKPGPTIGKIKEAIEEAILEGEIPNQYDAARAYYEKIKVPFLAGAGEWEKG